MKTIKNIIVLSVVLFFTTTLTSDASAYFDHYSGTGWTLGDGDYDGKFQNSSVGSDGTVTINCLITLTRCFSVGGNWIHLGVVQQGYEPPIQYVIQPKP